MPSRKTHVRWILIVGITASGLGLGACSQGVETKIQEGKEAYIRGHYRDALELFKQVQKMQADNVEAFYGHARSAHILHLYEEAIPAYESALRLAPERTEIWQYYIEALAWGGLLRGDRRLLEKALQRGHQALLVDPDRVETYDHIMTAARTMQALDRYAAILEGVAPEHPSSPVLDIKRWELRLQEVRTQGSEEIVTKFEQSLRTKLELLTLEAEESLHTNAAELFRLAYGYQLLNEAERRKRFVQALEQLPSGRAMATPMQWWNGFWDELLVPLQSGNQIKQLAVIRKWEDRFAPSWETGATRHGSILGKEFDLMVQLAEGRSVTYADSLIDLGEELIRYDTWGGASRYTQLVQIQVDMGTRLEYAVGLAQRGISAIRDNRPGLFYPAGPAEQELTEARAKSEARLLLLQGRAYLGQGKNKEAETTLLEGIEISPSAQGYAALGELLQQKGDFHASFEALVAALAQGLPANQVDKESRIRSLATEVAAYLGLAESDLEDEIRTRRHQREEERITTLVENRLDVPAPGFQLRDTEGKEWRLTDLKGKVVVLNYWATWCGPCIAELPHYRKLFEEYAPREDVIMLAISTDADPAVVKPWLNEKGYNFTVLYDEGSAVDNHVTGIPTIIIIGKEGHIQYRHEGFPGEKRYLEMMRLRIEALRQK